MRRYSILIVFFLISSVKVVSQGNEPFFEDYLTPQMFGAVGDGIRDDTDALRKALFVSSEQGKTLYFPSGYKYKITGTLNYYRGEYQNLTLNMVGNIPIKKGSYVPQEYGGIIVSRGVKLFQNAIMTGSIDRVCITGQRDLDIHFFDNCECKGLVIARSNISNFGALFYDSKLCSLSQVIQNTFLTLYYFARNEKSSNGMIDSNISFNYINGGMENNDNSCFEWSYYNGSSISNNFIDYYRTIYAPKAVSRQPFVGPQSYSNQYQVFRYFYESNPSLISFVFTSSSDTFNWNDPLSLKKLRDYVPATYKGKDGKRYDIPPYVACCNATWNITISNAKIERNMRSLVFVSSSLTEYEYNRFDVSFTGNNKYREGQINYKQGDVNPYYNNGSYSQNRMNIEGIVEVLDHLPVFKRGWSGTISGRTVMVNGRVYRAVNQFKSDEDWNSKWVEIGMGD